MLNTVAQRLNMPWTLATPNGDGQVLSFPQVSKTSFLVSLRETQMAKENCFASSLFSPLTCQVPGLDTLWVWAFLAPESELSSKVMGHEFLSLWNHLNSDWT